MQKDYPSNKVGDHHFNNFFFKNGASYPFRNFSANGRMYTHGNEVRVHARVYDVMRCLCIFLGAIQSSQMFAVYGRNDV